MIKKIVLAGLFGLLVSHGLSAMDWPPRPTTLKWCAQKYVKRPAACCCDVCGWSCSLCTEFLGALEYDHTLAMTYAASGAFCCWGMFAMLLLDSGHYENSRQHWRDDPMQAKMLEAGIALTGCCWVCCVLDWCCQGENFRLCAGCLKKHAEQHAVACKDLAGCLREPKNMA